MNYGYVLCYENMICGGVDNREILKIIFIFFLEVRI